MSPLFKVCISFIVLPVLLCAQNPNANFDFELSPAGTITANNQVNGWAISHGNNYVTNCNQVNCCNLTTQFSEIINTTNGYIDPVIGSVYPIYSVFGSDASDSVAATAANPQVGFPLKGNSVIRLNHANSYVGIESLTRTLTVTYTTNVLQIAYIMSVIGDHLCCESPGFKLSVSTSTCQFNFNTACPGATNQATFYRTITGNATSILTNPIFTKWRVMRFDLSDFIGQNVVITINAYRCTHQGHYGYAYVDASLSPGTFTVNNQAVQTGTANIPFCQSSTVVAPANYTGYQWSGPGSFSASSPSIVTSTSGIYTVQLSTGDPCTNATRTLMLNFTPPPVIQSSTTNVCPGKSAVLSYTGGGIGSFWPHNGSTAATVMVNPNVTTIYTLVSQDLSGCSTSVFYTLTVLPSPKLLLDPIPNACVGDSIKIKISGAANYSWSASNGTSSFGSQIFAIAAMQFNPLYFNIIGTSVSGCTASIQSSVVIWPNPMISLNIQPSNTVCVGNAITMIGTGAETYHWLGKNNFAMSGKTVSVTMQGLHFSGTYTLVAKDERGCVSQTTTVLEALKLPGGYFTETAFLKCVPFCSTVIFEADKNNLVPLTDKQWFINGSKIADGKYCCAIAGDHTVSINLKDANACINTISYFFTALPKPIANFNFSPTSPVENVDQVNFNDVSEGENLVKFNWNIRTDKKNWESNERNPSFVFENEGVFPVVLRVTNTEGCSDTIIKTITAIPDFSFYIPNSFTPNGDERNEVFRPVINATRIYSMEIYDRWGKIIFISGNNVVGWDGTFNGESCKQDEYTWKLHLTTIGGVEKVFIGSVFLLR